MGNKQEEIPPQGAPVPGSQAERDVTEGTGPTTQPMGEENEPS